MLGSGAGNSHFQTSEVPWEKHVVKTPGCDLRYAGHGLHLPGRPGEDGGRGCQRGTPGNRQRRREQQHLGTHQRALCPST